MRFSRTSERPGSGKKYATLVGGEKFFFAMNLSLGEAGPVRGTRRIFFAMALAGWEDRFYSGLNPVIYSALSRQQQRQRRWWSCTSCCCFPLRLFLRPLHDFYVPFSPFSPFPSCNISPRVSVLSRTARTPLGKFYLGNRRSSSSTSDVAVSS